MKYRIAAVSYVNTLPFLYGLGSPEIRDSVDVIQAHPARCAELLERGEVDIALCPVGALPGLSQYHIITDYCIGCDGPVRTVCVYSQSPLENLTHIILSAESRTSNLLIKMINDGYWGHQLEFIPASSAFSSSSISSGFLYIGDICFQKEREYACRTDLGQAWKEWTGLPFAFACWVSKDMLDSNFVRKLNAAFGEAFSHLEDIIYPVGLDKDVLQKYLTTNISFILDAGKKQAMRKFLAYCT